MPSGVQVGDVTAERAIIWSRTDRPARMIVEYAANEQLRSATTVEAPAALENSDFTARLDLGGLTPGEMVFYRVRFESLAHPGASSEPVTGRFRTAPRDRRRIKLAWSGDTMGQGWGINPDVGGLRTYETMLRHEPDLFVHSGDMIYADNPLLPEVRAARRPHVEERRHAGQDARWPRRSTSSAATTPTTCSTRTCVASMRPCRSSRSGTTTR